jgi:hypothetical protein
VINKISRTKTDAEKIANGYKYVSKYQVLSPPGSSENIKRYWNIPKIVDRKYAET